MLLHYYNQYLFPKMTQPAELTNLPTMNDEILKDLRRAQSSGSTEVAKAILNWSTSNAGRLATGNYHPAVRINATLLLASLNDRPPGASPPLPAQSTLGPLVGAVSGPERPGRCPRGRLDRPASLDALWLNAAERQQRSQRHCRNDVELANAPVPENRTPEGHAYLQRYALDMLRVLYTEARGAGHHRCVCETIHLARCAVDHLAVRHGQIATLDSSAKVPEAAEVAKAWTGNVADIFVSEQQRLLAMDPPKPAAVQTGPVQPQTTRLGGMGAGMGSGMGAGMDSEMYSAPRTTMSSESMGMDYGEMAAPSEAMMGMGGMSLAKPQPPEIFAARRRLIHALECLKFGLTGSRSKDPARTPGGLVSKLPQEEQQSISQMNETLLEVLAEVNNKDYDTRPKFTRMLAAQSKQLKRLSGNLAGDDAAAPEEADQDPGFPTGPGIPGFGLPVGSP